MRLFLLKVQESGFHMILIGPFNNDDERIGYAKDTCCNESQFYRLNIERDTASPHIDSILKSEMEN